MTITAVNDYTARGSDTFFIDFQVLSGDSNYPNSGAYGQITVDLADDEIGRFFEKFAMWS